MLLVFGEEFAGELRLAGQAALLRNDCERTLSDLKAGFTPEAEGRHIVSAADTTPLEMGKLLRKRFGSRNLTPRVKAPKAAVTGRAVDRVHP